MAIIDLQRRIHEAGRIRIGKQVDNTNGRGKRPTKLATFRLTSPNRNRIEAAARLYGGEPSEWEAPAGMQWEVETAADQLAVIVPPTELAFTQHYELWAASGCQRRCDGYTEENSGGPCLCDPEERECKPHTRLSVLLADMPGLGVWRLESQGWNAALELQGAVEVIHLAARHGQLLPATLRLEKRMTKRPGQGTRRFAVPVLDLDVTPAQMIGGTRFGQSLDGGERPQLAESMRSIAAAAPHELDASNSRPKPETSQASDADEAQSDNRGKEFRENVTRAGAAAAQRFCSATWRTITCKLPDGHGGKHRGETQAGEPREWATAPGKLTSVPDDGRPAPSIAEQAGAEVKARRRAPVPPPATLNPRPAAEAAAARNAAESAAPRPADGSQTAHDAGPRQDEAMTRSCSESPDLLPSAPQPDYADDYDPGPADVATHRAAHPPAESYPPGDDGTTAEHLPCPATYGSSGMRCNRPHGHAGQHNTTTSSARYAWGDDDENAGEPVRVCQCGDPDTPGSHSQIHCVAGGPGRECGVCGARGEHAPGCPDADPTDRDNGAGDAPEGPSTKPQNRKMHAMFRELGVTAREDRLIITGKILGYELNTSAGLTITEAARVIDTLESLIDAPHKFKLSTGVAAATPDEWITDVINAWVAAQAESEE